MTDANAESRRLRDRIERLESQMREANKAAREITRLVEADPRFETGPRTLKTSVLLYVDDILKATA